MNGPLPPVRRLASVTRRHPLARQYYGRPPLRAAPLLPAGHQRPACRHLDWPRHKIFVALIRKCPDSRARDAERTRYARLHPLVYHRYTRVPMVQRDTRQVLIDAAAEVIARHGVEAASTREIYLRAGVKAPTLYHHFGDKQGLLDPVVTDAFERYLAQKRALRATGDPAAHLRHGWHVLVAFPRANPSVYRLMWPAGHPDLPPAAAQSAQALRQGFPTLSGRV